MRGGYGIIYGGLQYADFGGTGRQGFQAQPGFSAVNGFDPAFALDTGVPAANVTLPNLDPSQVNFNGGCCTATYIAKSYGRPPMIQNWSLEVQREFAPDFIGSVAYVGQHSTHLRTNYNGVNRLNPRILHVEICSTSRIRTSTQLPVLRSCKLHSGAGSCSASTILWFQF